MVRTVVASSICTAETCSL
uniref:Uncharacterized protein n=1 Tax=Arundo donax TaxID=35708 RepID=A0A0A9FIA0_ARUDO